MLEYSLTILALLAVLIIPGPTNALLASSAHHVGISRSLRLIPAELIGYIYAMGLWWLLLNFTRDIWPALSSLLHLLSVIYVFWLAFSLWKMKQLHAHSQKFKQIKPSQLFYSTFKNPKALLFSVGIFPEATWQTMENYAISMLFFALILIPIALLWLFYGGRLLNGQLKWFDQAQLYRSSALFLIICMLPIIFRFFYQL